MSEQSGVYKIILYENIGISYLHTSASQISSVSNTGQIINITSEDNIFLNYTNRKQLGKNDRLMNSYELLSTIFDLSLDNLDLISNLGSIFGWIPVIYFRNSEVKILKTPLFLENPIEFDPLTTHKFDFSLVTQQPTINELLNYG